MEFGSSLGSAVIETLPEPRSLFNRRTPLGIDLCVFWLKQATRGRRSPVSVNVSVLGLHPPFRFCLVGMHVQYAFCRLPRPVFRQNILTVRPPSCLSNCLWEALGFAFPEPLAL